MDYFDHYNWLCHRREAETLKETLNGMRDRIEKAKKGLDDLEEALDTLDALQEMLVYWPEGKWSDEMIERVNGLKELGFTQKQLDLIFERNNPIFFSGYFVGDYLRVYIKDLPKGIRNVFWKVINPLKGGAEIMLETDNGDVLTVQECLEKMRSGI